MDCVDLGELWNPKLFTENSLGNPKNKVWRETWKEPQTGFMFLQLKKHQVRLDNNASEWDILGHSFDFLGQFGRLSKELEAYILFS